MTENNLTYYCPICINDFTDEGVKPFYCLHILCDACTEQYKNSSLIYKCPLCKSEPNPNMKYNITNMTYEPPEEQINHYPTECFLRSIIIKKPHCLRYIRNPTEFLCKFAVDRDGNVLQ